MRAIPVIHIRGVRQGYRIAIASDELGVAQNTAQLREQYPRQPRAAARETPREEITDIRQGYHLDIGSAELAGQQSAAHPRERYPRQPRATARECGPREGSGSFHIAASVHTEFFYSVVLAAQDLAARVVVKHACYACQTGHFPIYAVGCARGRIGQPFHADTARTVRDAIQSVRLTAGRRGRSE